MRPASMEEFRFHGKVKYSAQWMGANSYRMGSIVIERSDVHAWLLKLLYDVRPDPVQEYPLTPDILMKIRTGDEIIIDVKNSKGSSELVSLFLKPDIKDSIAHLKKLLEEALKTNTTGDTRTIKRASAEEFRFHGQVTYLALWMGANSYRMGSIVIEKSDVHAWRLKLMYDCRPDAVQEYMLTPDTLLKIRTGDQIIIEVKKSKESSEVVSLFLKPDIKDSIAHVKDLLEEVWKTNTTAGDTRTKKRASAEEFRFHGQVKYLALWMGYNSYKRGSIVIEKSDVHAWLLKLMYDCRPDAVQEYPLTPDTLLKFRTGDQIIIEVKESKESSEVVSLFLKPDVKDSLAHIKNLLEEVWKTNSTGDTRTMKRASAEEFRFHGQVKYLALWMGYNSYKRGSIVIEKSDVHAWLLKLMYDCRPDAVQEYPLTPDTLLKIRTGDQIIIEVKRSKESSDGVSLFLKPDVKDSIAHIKNLLEEIWKTNTTGSLKSAEVGLRNPKATPHKLESPPPGQVFSSSKSAQKYDKESSPQMFTSKRGPGLMPDPTPVKKARLPDSVSYSLKVKPTQPRENNQPQTLQVSNPTPVKKARLPDSISYSMKVKPTQPTENNQLQTLQGFRLPDLFVTTNTNQSGLQFEVTMSIQCSNDLSFQE